MSIKDLILTYSAVEQKAPLHTFASKRRNRSSDEPSSLIKVFELVIHRNAVLLANLNTYSSSTANGTQLGKFRE